MRIKLRNWIVCIHLGKNEPYRYFVNRDLDRMNGKWGTTITSKRLLPLLKHIGHLRTNSGDMLSIH